MNVPLDILGFLKAHEDDRVLSVYVDSAMTDPARRREWLAVLREGIHQARFRVEASSRSELESFEQCVAAVVRRLPADETPVRPGWMSLCAGNGDFVEARLPVAPTPMVSWGRGPVLFPYLVAAPVDDAIVVLIDLDHARILRLQHGVIHTLEALETESTTITVDSHMGDAPRAGFHPGTRGETQTDAAQRQKREARERLHAAAYRQVAVVAGHDAQVVVGGASVATAHFVSMLPDELAARTVVSDALRMTTPMGEVPALVSHAVTELRTRRQREKITMLERRAHLTRNAAFGFDPVIAAAAARAIDELLISETLWRARPVDIEALTHDALRSGAAVDVTTSACAGVLDALGGGIAAGLRFAVAKAEAQGHRRHEMAS